VPPPGGYKGPLYLGGRISTLFDFVIFFTAVSNYCLCLLALTTCCLTLWVPVEKAEARGNTGTGGV
jgi:hypothetical protein